MRFVAEAIAAEFPSSPLGSLRVLDVGCGNGSWLAIPLARCGFDVTGIDTHGPSIEHARRLAEGIQNSHFFAVSVANVSSPPFDVLILSEVLEHVGDPEELLRASIAHLKPRGIVIVTVPNGLGEFEVDSWIFRTIHLKVGIDLVKRFLAKRPAAYAHCDTQDVAASDNQNSPHVQFFSRRRLKQMFAKCSLVMLRESAGCFACGPIAHLTVGRSRRFIEWNAQVVDRLPLALASSWYFVLRSARSSP
ncbi:MAG: hypothetical protein C5B60_05705 [Chloroflexi bacterium]|nr:MAG: hypothetical protein C5B60_05705 [Chloroflexota bacterium]